MNKLNPNALEILATLRVHGFVAVLAGGCVRDMLMGKKPKDWDIATNAVPEKVESLFKHTIPVGKAFGVIIVVIEGENFEVATFRCDKHSSYSDGRRPDSVTFGDMKSDALRRDLTINGLFWDPIARSGECLIDFVGGKKDLDKKIIRFIGEPEQRIEEDKLRMLRAVRFAVKFEFPIENISLLAIVANSSDIHKVSQERIAEELLKMLRLHKPRRTLEVLNAVGLLGEILPEVSAMIGCKQPPDFHPEGDVMEHTIMVLEHLPKDASDELLLGALLHDVGKPPTYIVVPDRIRFNCHDTVGAEMATNILTRFRFPNKVVEQVVLLVKNHMKWICVKQMRVSRLKRFLRLERFEDHKALHKADCLSSHGKMDNLEFVNGLNFPPEEIKPEPLVNGKDLISLGITPGPVFREILTMVGNRQLEGVIRGRGTALLFVKEFIKISKG